ncbi:hypothetical protein BDW75DRAFT_223083, partial [Aspergillus navahoensis]
MSVLQRPSSKKRASIKKVHDKEATVNHSALMTIGGFRTTRRRRLNRRLTGRMIWALDFDDKYSGNTGLLSAPRHQQSGVEPRFCHHRYRCVRWSAVFQVHGIMRRP